MKSLNFPSYSSFHSKEIHSSIAELKDLNEQGFYTIPKVNWWLLKYSDLYKYCKENWNNGSCFGELPCSHTMGSEEDKFRYFYENLEEVVDLHKKEPYFREQMEKLKMVRDNYPSLMQWLRQNEKLGVEDFLIFWIEWLGEDGIVDPYIREFKKINIRFRSKEFENTINFLEQFNDLYWKSELVTK